MSPCRLPGGAASCRGWATAAICALALLEVGCMGPIEAVKHGLGPPGLQEVGRDAGREISAQFGGVAAGKIILCRFRCGGLSAKTGAAFTELGERARQAVLEGMQATKPWGGAGFTVLSSGDSAIAWAEVQITEASSVDQLKSIAKHTGADFAVLGYIERRGKEGYALSLKARNLWEGGIKRHVEMPFRGSKENDKLYDQVISFDQAAQIPPPVEEVLHIGVAALVSQLLSADKTEKFLVERTKSSQPVRIAIFTIRGPKPKEGETWYGELLGRCFLDEIVRQQKDRFVVLERKDLREVLAAQRIEYDDRTGMFFDQSTVQPADQSLGADCVVVGNLTPVARGILASVKLIDLRTKEVLSSAQTRLQDAQGQDDLFRLVADSQPLVVRFVPLMRIGESIYALRPDSQLPSGEFHKYRLRSDERCYVYCWQIDASGRHQALLPHKKNTGSDQPQPSTILEPGRELEIPASGPWWLKLDNNVGVETICLVVSRLPKKNLYDLLVSVPSPDEGAASRDSDQSRQLDLLVNPQQAYSDDAPQIVLRGNVGSFWLPGSDKLPSADMEASPDARRQCGYTIAAPSRDPDTILACFSFKHIP